MRLETLWFTAVGLLAFATSALADPMPSTAPVGLTSVAAVQSSRSDPNRMICHDRIATGSRLAYARDCHTRAEWDLITRAARDYINGQQLKGLNAAPPNG